MGLQGCQYSIEHFNILIFLAHISNANNVGFHEKLFLR